MSAERWERLRADLAAEGVEVTIDERPYTEEVYGRLTHGVTRSITIMRADAGHGPVVVRDTWWRDRWTGWRTSGEDREGIETYAGLRTKKRAAVVFDVLVCLGVKAASA